MTFIPNIYQVLKHVCYNDSLIYIDIDVMYFRHTDVVYVTTSGRRNSYTIFSIYFRLEHYFKIS